MPLSSAEIAASIGQYQQQYTGAQTHAGLIGNMLNASGAPQQSSQDIAGGILNRGLAVAGPVASFGAGLAGLDPLSMGMRAFGMGGRMGMGAAGAGALGLVGGGLVGGAAMAAQYSVQQMITGAQQQQAFNQGMRQVYFHQTPWGQGFGTGQLNQIASTMRTMAGEMGPSGEMSSFRELSSIALRMGQMGQMTGVRDVQEFTKRFRDMVSTLKTVAREMGTSLESAQEFVQSMKSGGVFRASDQMRVAREMRSLSVAGGLAVSELSAMGNIGSQISRSIGGRGLAGMYGGIRTMGQVGVALQTGSITEEDIYNSTGLTGAEGRQAYATAQMGNAANFLRGRFGRVFLASVAGEGGQLDADSVSRWRGGGVGLGETRGMTGRGLQRSGRAGFLRNEGRLRGEALRQFGGMLPAMAMQSWLDERGMDVANMGDREMILMSRLTGMGMDQLETTLKQVRDLPRMQDEQRISGMNDRMLRDVAARRKTMGVEGLKRKFEQTREHVQSALQQVGANIYTDLSNMIETTINKMSGMYTDEFDRDIVRAYESAKRGDRAALGRTFGIGYQTRAGFAATSAPRLAGMRTGREGSTWSRLTDAGMLNLGTSQLDRIKEAGYGGLFDPAHLGYSSGRRRDAAAQENLQLAQRISQAVGSRSEAGATFGGAFSEDIRKEYLRTGMGTTKGFDRIQAFERFMERRARAGTDGSARAEMQLQAFEKMSYEQKAAFVATAEEQAGIKGAAGLRERGGLPGGMMGGGFASRGELTEAIAAGLGGAETRATKWTNVGRVAGGIMGSTLAVPTLGASVAGGAVLGGKLAGWISGEDKLTGGAYSKLSRKQAETMTNFLLSEEGRDLAAGLMSSDPKAQAHARAKIQQMGIQSDAQGPEGKAMGDSMRMFQAMDEYARYVETHGQPSREAANKIAASFGVPGGGAVLESAMGTVAETLKIKQDANVRGVSATVGGAAATKMRRMVERGFTGDRTGFLQVGASGKYELTADAVSRLQKEVGSKGAGAIAKMFKVTAMEASLASGGMSTEQQRQVLGEASQMGAEAWNEIMSSNPSEQRRMAKQIRAMGDWDTAEQIERSATQTDRIRRLMSRKGAGAGMAAAMGISLNRQERGEVEKLLGQAGGGKGSVSARQFADVMARKLGIDTGERFGAYEKATADIESIDADIKAAGQGKMTAEKRQKLRELEEKKKELIKGRDTASEMSDAAMNIHSKLEEIAKERDPLERAKKMQQLTTTQDFQKVEKERREKEREQQDPNKPMVDALNALPAKFAQALTGPVLSVRDVSKEGEEGAPGT